LRQTRDTASRLEKILWNANLISFAIALCVFIAMVLTMNWSWWLLVPVVILVANFLAGLRFTSLPNTHLGEFQDALAHGEILLMVEVPHTPWPISRSAPATITRKQPPATLAGQQKSLVYK
jgi:hypothetical protein